MEYKLITLRELVGDVLIEAKKRYPDIYVLDSDLAKSTTTNKFQEVYPAYFKELGIAEQNAMSAAMGIAAERKIPFYVNFAIFVAGTCWTQLRQICYANANVKLIATHPGMDGSFDGATHHANEDIALTRVLPNLIVLDPANPEELKQAVQLAIEYDGPVYIRCSRGEVPDLPAKEACQIGKATITENLGDDFAILYEGPTADLAMQSFHVMTERGQKGKLVNVFSIKPFDKMLIREIASRVKRIVTVENHSVKGGIGSLTAESICDMTVHASLKCVGIEDCFTESGPAGLLRKKYGLTVENVCAHISDS